MEGIDQDRPLQEAARWHARLYAADCTEQERIAFERWRSECPANAAAYARAESVTARLDQLINVDARLQALADRAFQSSSSKPISTRPGTTRWALPAALAAGLALAIIAVNFSAQLLHPAAAVMVYDTADARRTFTLEDGSVVRMDVATRLEVRMSAERRQVELLSGRALFEVAHDKTRPFSVTASGARTTALGTRFQVQSEQGQVLVTLAEGSVAVDDGHIGSRWNERLRPGEQLSFDARSNAVDKHVVDLQYATSWSRGRHVFRGTPLAEAIAEINRYAHRKVRLGDPLGDPSLAALPVGGNFITGDSKLIVDAFAAVLPLRVVVGGGDEILLFRRYE
jgi:transmembrane sensor